MKLLQPQPTPYDPLEWEKLPFPERARLVCQAWSTQGYGAPPAIYAFYLLKAGLYGAGWLLFCTLDPSMSLADIERWWSSPIALHKALLWSVAFESLGLGCGSGPLTGRYLPPFTAALHFVRPGTTKLPLWGALGHRRTVLDAALYALLQGTLLYALCLTDIPRGLTAGVVALVLLLGVLDKTLFLIARAEHYLTALVCLLFVGDSVAGLKVVWLAVWLWAATSKLNRHFPAVVAVMLSNSPVTRLFSASRRWLYRDHPADLRPSRLAALAAHGGTAIEYSFPLALALSTSRDVTSAALVVMLVFHVWITSHIPMGVPLEWNVMMVYGGFALFSAHPEVTPWSVQSPALATILAVTMVGVPLVGNLAPRFVSFLCSMRYYAGNWPFSVWLFRGDAAAKLDEHLVKSAPRVQRQLDRFYDRPTIVALLSKVIAFRLMHLHGRVLHDLLPKAVDDIDAYEWLDGEIVAGLTLGWNFGDGHLHDERLLAAIQAQCDFEAGALRCIFVESQPLGRPTLAWRVVDARTGEIDAGETPVEALQRRQPWPDAPAEG